MSKVSRILIDEREIPDALKILCRLRSFSEIRNGIFSPIQRIRFEHPNAEIYYAGPESNFTRAFLERNPDCREFSGENCETVISPESFSSWGLISNVSNVILSDLELYKKQKKWTDKILMKASSYHHVGKLKHLYIHQSAVIYPGVVFDVTGGPVIIDKDVKITSFSFLEGPLYIGPGTHIDNARITGGTVIGSVCKIGGEVENSIFGDFSNKHHEGFVGHSHIGNWVNLGALSTTSDLKNNYGVVNVKVESSIINTGTIKFGAMIGDFSKIAIGVMLNTGASVDIGCNVVSERVSGYLRPFTWADSGTRYRLDQFLADSKKIMARRNQSLSQSEEELIRHVYEVGVK